MRAKGILCLMAFLMASGVQAQDLKIFVNQKGLIGYADQDGNEVIKCQYESGQAFENGVAIVTKGGKSGIIDATGNVLLPLKYSKIQTWGNNLYLIQEGKKMGLTDKKGTITLPVEYSLISSPNCYGKALIAQGGKQNPIPNEKKSYMLGAKYGIIDANGNVLVPASYKGLYEFSYDPKTQPPYREGRRLEFSYHSTTDTLTTDCSYLGFSGNGLSIYNAGIIDGNGKQLLAQGLYYFVMKPQSDMVRYYNVKKKQVLCGYHNLNTGQSFQAVAFDKAFNDITFWTHGDFIGDIAPVNGQTWSFINKTGQTLRSGYSSLIHSQPTGLWAAKNASNTWDVFDDSNNDVATLSGFNDIKFPYNEESKEVFSVQKEGKYGCITRSGLVVIPFDYDQALGNCYNMIAVKKDDKWGMQSTDNETLIPMEYISIVLPSELETKHMWVKKADSLYYHINLDTKQVSPTGYKAVSNYKDGIAHVIPLNMVIEDTQVNRAQLFNPNTPKATIYAADLEKNKQAFGYLINTDDKLVIDLPTTLLYKDAIVKEMKNLGSKELTASQKKNILLEVTRENRSYDLKSTLSEDEWNY